MPVVIRPIAMSDLDRLHFFANDVSEGFTSLPRVKVLLQEKIELSLRSFSDNPPEKAFYLFVMEAEGVVVGTCAIKSLSYTELLFKHTLEEHKNPYTKKVSEHALIQLCKAPKKQSEVGTLFLDRNHRKGGLGKLLSWSRFLFLAKFKERFQAEVKTELRGLSSPSGDCPFWDHICAPFYHMSFQEANNLRMIDDPHIYQLLPQHDIYLHILPKAVSRVVGTAHPNSKGAQKMIQLQGFKQTPYVDVFDAGPTFSTYVNEIKSVKESCLATAKVASSIESDSLFLVANEKLDYRALITPLMIQEEQILISKEALQALQLEEGEEFRYVKL